MAHPYDADLRFADTLMAEAHRRVKLADVTPEFRSELQRLVSSGKFNVDSYVFVDGGVRAVMSTFAKLGDIPPAVVTKAIESLPSTEQPAAWSTVLEDMSDDEVAEAVGGGLFSVNLLSPQQQVRLPPMVLYENRARVSLEVILGALEGFEKNYLDGDEDQNIWMSPLWEKLVETMDMLEYEDAQVVSLYLGGLSIAVKGGVLHVKSTSREVDPTSTSGVVLKKPIRKGKVYLNLNSKTDKVVGLPAGATFERISGWNYVGVDAKYSGKIIGKTIAGFWDDSPTVYDFPLMSLDREVAESILKEMAG